MDRIRFALWFGLLASLWISYTTWVSENAPEPDIAAIADTPGGSPAGPDDNIGVPVVGAAVGADQTPGVAGSSETAAAIDAARVVRVRTDVLDTTISLDGGNLVRADLPEYPVHKDRPDESVRLLDYGGDDFWVIQSGLASLPDTPAPTHTQAFTAAQTDYRLANDSDSLEVRLAWQGPNGISAEKIYTFRRGQYAIDL
jgi:YidC/Oxa1 family membrane protein insertase